MGKEWEKGLDVFEELSVAQGGWREMKLESLREIVTLGLTIHCEATGETGKDFK